jgi:serine/threonine protein phosphatase PrpC
MTLGQVVSVTDTGRKRRHNEDAFVSNPPLFAIADGMGGAQAGEVASRLAADALQEGGAEGSGEERVAALIQRANRRVYDSSGRDASLEGMGTTMTVALVEDGAVAIGHVGDSRAYLIRDGKLRQLTDDHSLVAELTRAGKLSEEEAESHPQRSVITRSVGTDPDVDVDTLSVETKAGDVFLLCSDGLTDMVGDQQILRIVNSKRTDLRVAAKALVKAANKRGGQDNITVVFFEVAEPAIEETKESVVPEAGAETGDEDTLSGLEGIPAIGAEEHVDEWARRERRPARAARTITPPARRGRLYGVAMGVAVLVVIGLLLYGVSRAHFVGAQKDGHVAVYQGLPWDLGAGLHLYRVVYVSPIRASQLTEAERKKLFDHDLVGYGSARTKVRQYEHEVIP